jgi:GGDEF domain-containing protein
LGTLDLCQTLKDGTVCEVSKCCPLGTERFGLGKIEVKIKYATVKQFTAALFLFLAVFSAPLGADSLPQQGGLHSQVCTEVMDGVAELAQLKKMPPAEVYELLLGYLKKELPTAIDLSREANLAFAANPKGILATGSGATVSFSGRWYHRQVIEGKMRARLLESDPVMEIPDGRDPEIRKIFEETVEKFSKNQGTETGEFLFYFNADVNGLKLVNDLSVSTGSFFGGGHKTGDAVLRIIGQAIIEANFKGIIARSGGDELTGIVAFKSEVEARISVMDLNARIAAKLNTYQAEQRRHYVNVLNKIESAVTWADLPQEIRPDTRMDFGGAKVEMIKTARDHLFRIEKDRPSLSIALGLINRGLSTEAAGLGVSAYDLVASETDRVMKQIKLRYKQANGLPTSREGSLDLTKAGQPWAAPEPPFVIRFSRVRKG